MPIKELAFFTILAVHFAHFVVLFCSRFNVGSMMSCLRISPACSVARMNCCKSLRHFSSVTSRFVRSSSLVLGGSAIITGTLYARLHWKSRVLCRAKSWTRTVDLESNNGDKEHQFPWKEFLRLLLPDIWYLIGAILVWSLHVMFCI